MIMPNLSDPTSWIEKMIEQAVAASPANDLGSPEPEPAFNRPLVGFSSGADPLYTEYVSHIGDFYLTPLQIFQKAFPAHPLPQPEDLTVISWILPLRPPRAPSRAKVKSGRPRAGREPAKCAIL